MKPHYWEPSKEIACADENIFWFYCVKYENCHTEHNTNRSHERFVLFKTFAKLRENDNNMLRNYAF